MTFHCGDRSYETLEEMMADLKERSSWWENALYATWYPAKRRLRDAQLAVKWAWQRVFRGWDDRAVWNIDSRLSKSLGEQLVTMSEIAHGCPDVYGAAHFIPDDPAADPRFVQWKADLRIHGESLLAYNRFQWEDHPDDAFDDIYKPAQEALVWVSENLASLWD